MAPKAILLAGLGYGDCGKGTITEYLVAREKAPVVVRYNGGAQAGHNVVTNDGKHHCFSQFGSGSFQGARTHLSRFVLVDPLAMIPEAQHLQSLGLGDIWKRLTIERDALLVTPYHRAANRLRELARTSRHGSCGMGIGETMQTVLEHPDDVPRIGDLGDPAKLRRKLAFVQALKVAEVRSLALPDPAAIDDDWRRAGRAAALQLLEDVGVVADRYAGFADTVRIVGPEYLAELLRGPVVFEGAQGVLLDQDFGFQPYTTWTDTTFGNANRLLEEAGFAGEVERVGVVRTHSTRHGAGPLVTEQPDFELPGEHNRQSPWQGAFRAGPLDLVALRYALDVIGGVDALAVTHMDRRAPMVCAAYDVHDEDGAYFDGPARIQVGSPAALAYQEGLARALLRARPCLEPSGDLLSRLGALAPVRILSAGPRLADKRGAT